MLEGSLVYVFGNHNFPFVPRVLLLLKKRTLTRGSHLLLLVLELRCWKDNLTLLFYSKASRLSLFCPRLLDILNVICKILLLSVFKLNMGCLRWKICHRQSHRMLVSFYSRCASWGRNVFKCRIMNRFCSHRWIIAILYLLF